MAIRSLPADLRIAKGRAVSRHVQIGGLWLVLGKTYTLRSSAGLSKKTLWFHVLVEAMVLPSGCSTTMVTASFDESRILKPASFSMEYTFSRGSIISHMGRVHDVWYAGLGAHQLFRLCIQESGRPWASERRTSTIGCVTAVGRSAGVHAKYPNLGSRRALPGP